MVVKEPPTLSARILVVEDDADTARMMSRLLNSSGYPTMTAGSVAEAKRYVTGIALICSLQICLCQMAAGPIYCGTMKIVSARGSSSAATTTSGTGQLEWPRDIAITCSSRFASMNY